mmetsp:Transcript_142976/g.347318  ORF Transcript_142976/g.347318 Transcript_142976/m.347318 type:complete len:208 (-) Transcript_142976:721-1344(-)
MVEDSPEPRVHVFHGLMKIVVVQEIAATRSLGHDVLTLLLTLLLTIFLYGGYNNISILLLLQRLRCQIKRVNIKLSFRSARRQLACPILSAPRVLRRRISCACHALRFLPTDDADDTDTFSSITTSSFVSAAGALTFSTEERTRRPGSIRVPPFIWSIHASPRIELLLADRHDDNTADEFNACPGVVVVVITESRRSRTTVEGSLLC